MQKQVQNEKLDLQNKDFAITPFRTCTKLTIETLEQGVKYVQTQQ